MAWIDSRYLDQQRKLEREVLQLRREWDELKFEITARRTAARREVKAARIAFEKLWHDLQLSAEQQKAGFNPDQPRDDHGKWTDAGGGDKGPADDAPKPGLDSKPAFLRTLMRSPGIPPATLPGDQAAIEKQLSQYNLLSRLNGPNSTAVFQFSAHAFQPGSTRNDLAVHVGQLTRDQVDEACPRHVEVQSIANQSAAVINRRDYPSAAEYGTAVHTRIRDEINGPRTDPPSPPRDPDFRSELSIIKSKEADRYGERGSKRVDVYENPHTGTVCIYDIKTGETGLSFARMRELATNVGTFYPGTTRIVVTEMRPSQ